MLLLSINALFNGQGEMLVRIDIQTSGFILTDGLHGHARRRLQFALNWANHDVRKVAVRLSDINVRAGATCVNQSWNLPGTSP